MTSCLGQQNNEIVTKLVLCDAKMFNCFSNVVIVVWLVVTAVNNLTILFSILLAITNSEDMRLSGSTIKFSMLCEKLSVHCRHVHVHSTFTKLKSMS